MNSVRVEAHSFIRCLKQAATVALLTVVVTGSLGACRPADEVLVAIPAEDENLGWQELRDLSDFERAALADKHVDAAEVHQASENMIECVKRYGIRVGAGVPASTGPSGIVFEFDAASDPEAERLLALAENCRAEVSAVESVWIMQEELGDDERRETMAAFVDCVRQAGVNLRTAATFDEAVSVVEAELDKQGRDAPAPVVTTQLVSCIADVDIALTTALPGLREALESLNTEKWTFDRKHSGG